MDVKEPASLGEELHEEALEIRLSDIVGLLKRIRRTMLIGSLVGAIFGIGYAFLQPNQYSSQVTVMPELQARTGGNLGNLSSLAGLAGISLEGITSNSEVIRPDLYPTVAQSLPFAIYLLNQPVKTRGSKKYQSLRGFLLYHSANTISGWLSTIFSESNGSEIEQLPPQKDAGGIVQLTKFGEENVNDLLQRVSVTFDKKTGIVTIMTIMPDPVVAATVARYTLDYLTSYITSYRTEKARKEVTFLTNQVEAVRKRYQIAEFNLASYRDKNRNQYLNTAKIEEQRIQAEYVLAQDLYNSLSKQLELSKIKIQEQTPVFKVLNPAQVPLRKSKPNRVLLITGITIGGVLASIGLSFIQTYLKKAP